MRWIEETSQQNTLNDATTYTQFPWHLIESPVEAKSETELSRSQTMAYCAVLRQASPNKVGLYGLSTRPQDYSIIWDDPEGPVISLSTPWTESNLLFSYVNSLYHPPFEKHINDPSIKLYSGRIYAQEKPEWEIDGFSGPFKTIFIGAAHSRMTHVLQRDPNTIVKYSFQSTGRRFSEVDILNKIHKFGPVPGVVQYSPEGSKDVCSAFGEPIHTPGELKNDQLPKHMTKTQLQLLSSGREFENCKDVRQALMICYDILEGSCSYFETKHILKDHLVHKYLVEHRGVLHWDIVTLEIWT